MRPSFRRVLVSLLRQLPLLVIMIMRLCFFCLVLSVSVCVVRSVFRVFFVFSLQRDLNDWPSFVLVSARLHFLLMPVCLLVGAVRAHAIMVRPRRVSCLACVFRDDIMLMCVCVYVGQCTAPPGTYVSLSTGKPN